MEDSDIKTKIFLLIFAFVGTLHLNAACVDVNVSDMNLSKLFQKPLMPTHEDFRACYNKNKEAFLKIGGVHALAIDKHYAISFEKPKNYLRYDPFLKLYLIYCEDELKPVKMEDDRKLDTKDILGSLTKQRIAFGKFRSFGTPFDGFDKLFFRDKKGSLITDGCCGMYGVGKGNKNFIPNRYLKRFLENESNFYGDIGASFYTSKDRTFISSLDPYRAKNLCIGDEIVSVNGMRVSSKSHLLELIMFADKNSTLLLHVKRAGKMREIEVKPYLRPKYPYRDSTYLKQTGMVFGKNLTLIKVTKNSFAHKSGLKKGDRLMEINFKKVQTTRDIRRALLRKSSNSHHLLFTRDDFQFFINIDKKDRQGNLFALPNCPAI